MSETLFWAPLLTTLLGASVGCSDPATTSDVGNTAGSGGKIQTDTVGVLLQNAGNVGLNDMTLMSNGVGVQAQNVQSLTIGHTTISGSSSFGVDALNVQQKTVRLTSVCSASTGKVAKNSQSSQIQGR